MLAFFVLPIVVYLYSFSLTYFVIVGVDLDAIVNAIINNEQLQDSSDFVFSKSPDLLSGASIWVCGANFHLIRVRAIEFECSSLEW